MRIFCVCLLVFIYANVCLSKIFKIAWIVPDSNQNTNINSASSVGALKLALKAVSDNTNILNGHTIKIKHFTTECNPKSSMMATMLARISFDPDVYIGPPCTEAMKVVAQLAGFWNIPTFSWYNPGLEFDKKEYPTLIRMSPPNDIMGQSLLHLLNQHSWRKFSLIYHSDPSWVDLKSTVEAAILPTDIRILSTQQVHGNTTDYEFQQMFTKIKKITTIIVFACPVDLIRHYMLAADILGMGNGEFVFIHLDNKIYSDTMLKTQVIGDHTWKRGDMYDNAARKIMESLIHVMIDPMNDAAKPTNPLPRSMYTQFAGLVTGSYVNNTNWELPTAGNPDVYSLYLYDVMLVWAVLADKIDKAGQDYRNAHVMSSFGTEIYADGATGYIAMDTDLDRLAKVFILDMNSSGQFQPVQILKFNTTKGYNVVNMAPLTTLYRWGNTRVGSNFIPSDEPMPESKDSIMRTPTKITNMGTIKSRLKSIQLKPVVKQSLNINPATGAQDLKVGQQKKTSHYQKGSKYQTQSIASERLTKQSFQISKFVPAILNIMDDNYKTQSQNNSSNADIPPGQYNQPSAAISRTVDSVSVQGKTLKATSDKTINSRYIDKNRYSRNVGYVATTTTSPPDMMTNWNSYWTVKPVTNAPMFVTARELRSYEAVVTSTQTNQNIDTSNKYNHNTKEVSQLISHQRTPTEVVDQFTGTTSAPTKIFIGDWISHIRVSDDMTPEMVNMYMPDSDQNSFGFQPILFNQYPLNTEQVNNKASQPKQGIHPKIEISAQSNLILNTPAPSSKHNHFQKYAQKKQTTLLPIRQYKELPQYTLVLNQHYARQTQTTPAPIHKYTPQPRNKPIYIPQYAKPPHNDRHSSKQHTQHAQTTPAPTHENVHKLQYAPVPIQQYTHQRRNKPIPSKLYIQQPVSKPKFLYHKVLQPISTPAQTRTNRQKQPPPPIHQYAQKPPAIPVPVQQYVQQSHNTPAPIQQYVQQAHNSPSNNNQQYFQQSQHLQHYVQQPQITPAPYQQYVQQPQITLTPIQQYVHQAPNSHGNIQHYAQQPQTQPVPAQQRAHQPLNKQPHIQSQNKQSSSSQNIEHLLHRLVSALEKKNVQTTTPTPQPNWNPYLYNEHYWPFLLGTNT